MERGIEIRVQPAADPVVVSSRKGRRAVLLSFLGLAATFALQAAVVASTGSVALFADAVHNLGDALTAVPLWIAFRLAPRKPDGRFTYGYGRLEDVAGLAVVAVIVATACLAAGESVRRFMDPRPVAHLWAVAAASLAGFLGNEAVAAYRIRVGREIGSAALVADGKHARGDALASLAVLAGALGVRLGRPEADPAAGLLISAFILKMAWDAGREVFGRLLDAVDPRLPEAIRDSAAGVPGVAGVSEIRVRWVGHRICAEVNVAVDGRIPVSEGHAVAVEVRHRLLHALPFLADATIHVDPEEASGTASHAPTPEPHDGLGPHAH